MLGILTSLGWSFISLIAQILSYFDSDSYYDFIEFIFECDSSAVCIAFGILAIILLIIIFKFIIWIFKPNKAASSTKSKRDKRSYNNVNHNMQMQEKGTKAYSRPSRRGRRQMTGLDSVMEDKDNDWLAKQYIEEERSRRTCVAGELNPNAARMLKQSHADNCDARKVKLSHRAMCDSNSVDSGEYR